MVPDKTPCSCAMCRMELAYAEKPEFAEVTQKLGKCLLAAVEGMKAKYDPNWSDEREPHEVVDDAALYMLLGRALYEHTLEVLTMAQTTKLQADLEDEDDDTTT